MRAKKRGTGLPDVARENKSLRRAQGKTRGTICNRNVPGCSESSHTMVAFPTRTEFVLISKRFRQFLELLICLYLLLNLACKVPQAVNFQRKSKLVLRLEKIKCVWSKCDDAVTLVRPPPWLPIQNQQAAVLLVLGGQGFFFLETEKKKPSKFPKNVRRINKKFNKITSTQ